MKVSQIATIIFLASFKLGWVAMPLSITYGFAWWEVCLYNTLGGIIGIIFFTYVYEGFKALIYRLSPRLKARRDRRPTFSKKNRRLVKFKQRFGLVGIAFMSPTMISLPVGVIIANSFVTNKPKLFLYMTISVIAWTLAGGLFGEQIYNWISNLTGEASTTVQ